MRMKKLFQTLLASVLAVTSLVTFASCGGNENNPDNKDPDHNDKDDNPGGTTPDNPNPGGTTPDNPQKPDDGTIEYSTKVLYPDGTVVTGVSAQWCTDSTCLAPEKVDAQGVAKKYLAPNKYYVHLNNVPDGYTYNPNITVVTKDKPSVEITLMKLKSFAAGEKGEKYNTRYMLSEGAFELTFKSTEEIFYLGFEPTQPGIYEIESLVVDKAAVNQIDPELGYYGANKQNIPDDPIEMAENGEGLNFKYTIIADEDSFVHTSEAGEDGKPKLAVDANGNYISGSSYTFGISVKSADDFDATVAFVVRRTGDYNKEETKVEVMVPTENFVQAPNASMDETFVYMPFDGSMKAVYNETDGYYHLGVANSPTILYAKISSKCAYLDTAISKIESEHGNSALTLAGGTRNYSNFIAQYAQYCNDDGVYPVTKELQIFLNLFQASQNYFDVGGWIVEQIEGTVVKGNEWLFAVGYYGDAKAGIQIYEAGMYTNTIPANGTLYYTLNSSCIGTYTIVIGAQNLNTLKLIINGQEIMPETSGLTATIKLNNKEACPFEIVSSSNQNQNIFIRISVDKEYEPYKDNTLNIANLGIEDYVYYLLEPSAGAATYTLSSEQQFINLKINDVVYDASNSFKEGKFSVTLEIPEEGILVGIKSDRDVISSFELKIEKTGELKTIPAKLYGVYTCEKTQEVIVISENGFVIDTEPCEVLSVGKNKLVVLHPSGEIVFLIGTGILTTEDTKDVFIDETKMGGETPDANGILPSYYGTYLLEDADNQIVISSSGFSYNEENFLVISCTKETIVVSNSANEFTYTFQDGNLVINNEIYVRQLTEEEKILLSWIGEYMDKYGNITAITKDGVDFDGKLYSFTSITNETIECKNGVYKKTFTRQEDTNDTIKDESLNFYVKKGTFEILDNWLGTYIFVEERDNYYFDNILTITKYNISYKDLHFIPTSCTETTLIFKYDEIEYTLSMSILDEVKNISVNAEEVNENFTEYLGDVPVSLFGTYIYTYVENGDNEIKSIVISSTRVVITINQEISYYTVISYIDNILLLEDEDSSTISMEVKNITDSYGNTILSLVYEEETYPNANSK